MRRKAQDAPASELSAEHREALRRVLALLPAAPSMTDLKRTGTWGLVVDLWREYPGMVEVAPGSDLWRMTPIGKAFWEVRVGAVDEAVARLRELADGTGG